MELKLAELIIRFVLGMTNEVNIQEMRVTLENALRIINALPTYTAEEAIRALFTEDLEDAQ